jgi:hypothetical protein
MKVEEVERLRAQGMSIIEYTKNAKNVSSKHPVHAKAHVAKGSQPVPQPESQAVSQKVAEAQAQSNVALVKQSSDDWWLHASSPNGSLCGGSWLLAPPRPRWAARLRSIYSLGAVKRRLVSDKAIDDYILHLEAEEEEAA